MNKTAFSKGFPLFILPVRDTFGTNLATVSFVFSLARSGVGPTDPLTGWLVDRYGPRAALFWGATMGGVGFLLLGRTPNIWAYALVYLGLVTAGSSLGFTYSIMVLLNNWFFRQKALALSTRNAIDSLIPAMLVPLLGIAIATQGWRATSTALGVTLLLVLPLTSLIRNTPESMGLVPDGEPDTGGARTQDNGMGRQRVVQPPIDYETREAMRTPAFWVLVAGAGLRLSSKGAVMLHIIPILVAKGTDEQTAALFLGLLLFVTVPGCLIVGWLADRIPRNLGLGIASLAGAFSFALLASPFTSFWVIIAFVLLFSITEAGSPTNWAVLGEYFGRKNFGQLFGFARLACFPVVLIAPVFVGWWYDQYNSYTFPLWIFTVVLGLSALAFSMLRRPQSNETVIALDPI